MNLTSTFGENLYNIKRPGPQDPFLTPGQIELPRNIKDLFRLAQRFFFNDPLMGKIIRIQANYPITELIIETPDRELKRKWEIIVNEILDIRNLLLNIGLDFYTYGNAFVAIIPPVNRTGKCKSCGQISDVLKIKNIKLITEGELTNSSPENIKMLFSGICPACRKNTKFEIIDLISRDIAELKIARWNPLNIDIEYNSITGYSKYYYIFTQDDKNKIKNNDPEYLASVPMVFLKAIKLGYSKFRIHNRLIYHFKSPTISGPHPAWGKPFYMNIMKLLYIIQQFWKTNEFIAWEHTVPLRVIYPAQGQSDESPPAGMRNFIGRINGAIKQWATDKSAILIHDTPLGYQRIGGEGRAYFLVAEIREAQDQVLTALDFPRELILGGPWSGQFAAMRLLENSYSNYLRDLKKFLEFLTTRIHEFFGIPMVDISLKRFSRIDDAAYISQIGQLAAAGVISKKYYFDLQGIDYEKEKEQIQKERLDDLNFESEIVKEKSKIMADSKNAYIKTLLKNAMDLAENELIQLGTNIPQHVDFEAVIDKLVYEILSVDENQRGAILDKISQKAPLLAQLVSIKIQGLMDFIAQQEQMIAESEQQEVEEINNEIMNDTENEQNVGRGTRPLSPQNPPRRKTVSSG